MTARTAYGLDSGPDRLDWRQHAACKATMDMHSDPGKPWSDKAARMAHICRTHCPVIVPCLADAEEHRPVCGVQGGRVWVHAGAHTGRPVDPPDDPGCGPWCTHLRTPAMAGAR